MRPSLKSWLYTTFQYHSQNLAKEDARDLAKVGKPYKGSWIAWRCWWKMFNKPCRFEFHSKRGFRGGITFDWADNEITFSFQPIFFSVYFTVGGLLKGDWKRKEKEISFSLHEEYFWINIWRNPMESNSTDPWYYHITIHWKDILMGKQDFKQTLIKEENTALYMPEATYPVNIKFYRCIWKRRRWPWYVDSIQADMKPEKGILVPGKGENSWDCGDDHINGLWCSVKSATVADALPELLRSAIRSRSKYGSGLEMYVKREVV